VFGSTKEQLDDHRPLRALISNAKLHGDVIFKGKGQIKGWTYPSHIQSENLGKLLDRSKNYPSLLCQARTGAGKTGVFGLCILARINTRIPNLQV
jgi:superfamily II DNA/RNA helicase